MSNAIEQVRSLVQKMQERKREGTVLTAEVVMTVLEKKLPPAVFNVLGGVPGVAARVKQMLAPPRPVQQDGASNDESEDSDDDPDFDDEESDDDDDDASFDSSVSGSSGSDSGSDSDSDDDSDDSDDSDSFEGDDDSSAATGSGTGSASGGLPKRRDREDDSPAAPANAEEHATAMLAFAKKLKLSGARGKTDAESWEEYRSGHLMPLFAAHELAPTDFSKDAVKRHKIRLEVAELEKEADMTLDKSQRKGRPIFDEKTGKLKGVVGAAPAAQSSALCDEE